MAKLFEKEIGILIDDEPIGNELQLYECGFEECRPTKPYEFIPIDYWVLHYSIFRLEINKIISTLVIYL